MKISVNLECSVCKNRNYTVDKNKAQATKRLEIKKYCKHCQRRTIHRETK